MRSSISVQSWASVPPAPALQRDDGVAAVVLAREQGLLLQQRDLGLERRDRVVGLGQHGVVLADHLEQRRQVADLALEPAVGLELALARATARS